MKGHVLQSGRGILPRRNKATRLEASSTFTPWLWAAISSLVAAIALRAADSAPAPLSSADTQFFETKIRPLLAAKCYDCHSKTADKVRGGLLLDSREALLAGGNSGAAITPGKPDDSLLIQAIRYEDEDLQMPPARAGGKLSDQQIADLTEWVRRGAPDPRSLVAAGSAHSYGGVGKAHWAFQPVKKPEVPAVKDTAWPKNPIDNFVLAKLEAAGMTPNAPADKATLIRRVYFDLIGLPPSVRDVEAFLNDNSPDALAKIVDKLLASPLYGEHWARYWLDVARYSDTKGDPKNVEDYRYPHAWTYRDWVIGAMNADLPYNEFILEQLAGDRVEAMLEKKAKDKNLPAPENRWPLAAMGFLTLGNRFDGRVDDIIADQIDVTTKAFLGLTVACARCHDHKFDPIPTKDYYSLYGVFANSRQPPELPTLQAKVSETPAYAEYLQKSAELTKQEQQVEAERREFQIARRAALGNARGKQAAAKAKEMMASNTNLAERQKELRKHEQQLQRERGDLEANDPGSPPRANVLVDVPRSVDYPVLLRGEVGNRGEVVPRRFLEVLSPDPAKRPEWHQGSGRLQLALAITDPKNPLTARVIVNRIWQQHWGTGFVPTPDDLGNMSAPPTHPELLDWLAATFVEKGWSLKQLHRMIVLSAAYQQSSKNNPQFAEQDPNNKLLWRYNLRRLDFEQMHDALLAITGELDLERGGRPVPIGSEDFAKRRAIYTLIDRRNPPELLTQFDFPSPDVESGRRYETLVPQQALFLMNSPMVIETARKLVTHPSFTAFKTDEERVTALYLTIYQRMPTPQEIALGLKYVKANPQGTGLDMPPEPAMSPQQVTARERQRARQKALREAQKKFGGGRYSNAVGGDYDHAAPLNAWTKLAHALFQSNEAMFYD